MAPTSTAVFRAVADFQSLNRAVRESRKEIKKLQAQSGQTGDWERFDAALQSASESQAKLRKETDALAASQGKLGKGASGVSALEKSLSSLATAQDKAVESSTALGDAQVRQIGVAGQLRGEMTELGKSVRSLTSAEDAAIKRARDHKKALGDESNAASSKTDVLNKLSETLRQTAERDRDAAVSADEHAQALDREASAAGRAQGSLAPLSSSSRDAGRAANVAAGDHDLFREALDRVASSATSSSSSVRSHASSVASSGSSAQSAVAGNNALAGAIGASTSAANSSTSAHRNHAGAVSQSGAAARSATSSSNALGGSLRGVGAGARQGSAGSALLSSSLNPLKTGLRAAGEAGQGLKVVLLGLAIPAVVAGIQLLGGSLSALVSGLVAVVAAAGPAVNVLAALGPAAITAAGAIGTIAVTFRGVGDALKAMGKLEQESGQKSSAAAKQRVADAKAIGAAQRGVRDAIQSQQDAEAAGARSIADAQRSLSRAREDAADSAVQASRRVEDANDDLVRANERVIRAEEDLHDARRQAIRDLEDLNERIGDNALSLEGAEIRLLRAQERQREVNADAKSTALDRREAALSVAEAQDNLSDVQRQSTRDTTDLNAAQKAGVNWMPGVVSAQDSLSGALDSQQQAARDLSDAQAAAAKQQRDSAQAVGDAERNLTEAREDAARRQRDAAERVQDAVLRLAEAQAAAAESSGAMSAASRDLASALEKLSPKGRELVELLFSMRGKLDELTKVGQEAMFPGLINALKLISPLIDSVAIPSVRAFGTVIGSIGERLAVEVVSWEKDLYDFGTGAGPEALNRVGDILVNLLSAMEDVGVAATPLFLWLTELGVRLSAYWRAEAEAGRRDGSLVAYFEKVRRVLELLGDIIYNLGGQIKSVFEAAAPYGERMLRQFEELTRKTREWMNTPEGKDRLNKYFDKTSENASKVLGLLGDMGLAFLKMGESPALGKMLDSINVTMKPSLAKFFEQLGKAMEDNGPAIIELLSSILDIFTKLMEGEGGGFAAFIAVLQAFADTLNFILSIPGIADLAGFLLAIAGGLLAIKAVGKITGLSRLGNHLNSLAGGAGRAAPAVAAAGGRGPGGAAGPGGGTPPVVPPARPAATTAGGGFVSGARGSPTPAATGTGRLGQWAGSQARRGAQVVGATPAGQRATQAGRAARAAPGRAWNYATAPFRGGSLATPSGLPPIGPTPAAAAAAQQRQAAQAAQAARGGGGYPIPQAPVVPRPTPSTPTRGGGGFPLPARPAPAPVPLPSSSRPAQPRSAGGYPIPQPSTGAAPTPARPLVVPGAPAPTPARPLVLPGAAQPSSGPLVRPGAAPTPARPLIVPGGAQPSSGPLVRPGAAPTTARPLVVPGATPPAGTTPRLVVPPTPAGSGARREPTAAPAPRVGGGGYPLPRAATPPATPRPSTTPPAAGAPVRLTQNGQSVPLTGPNAGRVSPPPAAPRPSTTPPAAQPRTAAQAFSGNRVPAAAPRPPTLPPTAAPPVRTSVPFGFGPADRLAPAPPPAASRPPTASSGGAGGPTRIGGGSPASPLTASATPAFRPSPVVTNFAGAPPAAPRLTPGAQPPVRITPGGSGGGGPAPAPRIPFGFAPPPAAPRPSTIPPAAAPAARPAAASPAPFPRPAPAAAVPRPLATPPVAARPTQAPPTIPPRPAIAPPTVPPRPAVSPPPSPASRSAAGTAPPAGRPAAAPVAAPAARPAGTGVAPEGRRMMGAGPGATPSTAAVPGSVRQQTPTPAVAPAGGSRAGDAARSVGRGAGAVAGVGAGIAGSIGGGMLGAQLGQKLGGDTGAMAGGIAGSIAGGMAPDVLMKGFQKLGPLVDKVKGGMSSLASTMSGAVASAARGAVSALGSTVSKAGEVAGALGKAAGGYLKLGAQAAGAAIKTLAVNAASLVVRTGLALWAAAQWLLNAAMSANPIALVVIAIAALVAALIWAWNNSETFRNIVIAMWEGIKAAFSAAIAFIKPIWDVFWNGLSSTAIAVWNVISTFFTGAFSVFSAVFSAVWNVLSAVWSAFWSGIQTVAMTIWDAISVYFFAVWEVFKAAWQVLVDLFSGNWSNLWTSIQALGTAIWNAIAAFFSGAWEAWKAIFVALLGVLTAGWNAFWEGVKSVGTAVWNAIASFFTAAWEAWKTAFNAVVTFIQTLWNSFWETLKTVASTAWEWLKTGIDNALKFVQNVFQSAVDGIKSIWEAIKEIVAVPIRFVVNTVWNQGVVALWNKVADLLPGIEPIGTVALPFAAGGPVPGVGNTDSVKAVLTPGEFVVRKQIAEPARKFLEALNSGQPEAMQATGMAVRRYVHGGVVSAEPPPRPFAVGGEFVDGGAGGNWYNPLPGIVDGFFATFVDPLIGQIDNIVKPPPTWNSIPKAIAQKVRDGIHGFLMELATLGGTVPGSGPAQEQVRLVANKYGWDMPPEWDAIVRLVQKESGWNPNAANPNSSARGLFQKMTSIHGPVEPTPAGQAEWGLNYIKGRYGSPSKALSFHDRNNYYARGGPVTGSSDTEHAMLTPGEFVIRKEAADAIGLSTLRQMNAVRTPGSGNYDAVQRMAMGGTVMRSSGPAYQVKRGDTLSGIAMRFGTTCAELKKLNSMMNANKLMSGQWLNMPKKPDPKGAAKSTTDATDVSRYQIQRGDTLSALAKKFNTTVAELARVNNIKDPNKIYSGAWLSIPKGQKKPGDVTPAPTQPSTPPAETGIGGTEAEKETLASWGSAMAASTKDQKEFESNLLQLTRWGYSDLAKALLKKGIGTSEEGGLALSREAVKSPSAASKVNEVIKQSSDVIGESLETVLAVMAALQKTKGLGIRDVSTETKIDTKAIFDAMTAKALAEVSKLPAENRDKFLSNMDSYKRGLAFASGGRVGGQGNGDTVPAMLTPGEFVLRKAAAARIGMPTLHRLNQADKVPVQAFADGGSVMNAADLFSLVSPPSFARPMVGRAVQERLAAAVASGGDTTNSKSVVFNEGAVKVMNPAPARAVDSFESVMQKLSWSGVLS